MTTDGLDSDGKGSDFLICRKCGCRLERGVKTCPYCDEVVGDASIPKASSSRKERVSLLPLHSLAPVPETREETLAELYRLQKYFAETANKYEVMDDLLMKAERWKEPSFFRWMMAGGFVATLCYFLILINLPKGFVSLFFILWAMVTVVGYTESGRRYEKVRERMAGDILQLRNAIRTHFNHAENCFLPLDYTEQTRLKALIEDLDSGRSASFEDYRLEKDYEKARMI